MPCVQRQGTRFLPADLEAVVFRGVVGGGDHHAGRKAVLADREIERVGRDQADVGRHRRPDRGCRRSALPASARPETRMSRPTTTSDALEGHEGPTNPVGNVVNSAGQCPEHRTP